MLTTSSFRVDRPILQDVVNKQVLRSRAIQETQTLINAHRGTCEDFTTSLQMFPLYWLDICVLFWELICGTCSEWVCWLVAEAVVDYKILVISQTQNHRKIELSLEDVAVFSVDVNIPF